MVAWVALAVALFDLLLIAAFVVGCRVALRKLRPLLAIFQPTTTTSTNAPAEIYIDP